MSASKASTSPRPISIADVTGLQSALNAAANDSVTWTSLPGKPSTFSPSSHSHVIADVTGLQTALDGRALVVHTHAISDVTGLQTALNAKVATTDFTWANLAGKPSTFAPSAHSHVIADVTGLQTALDAKPLLGSTAGLADTASGTAGSAVTAARSDHTHPLPAGRLQLIGNVTHSQTVGVGLTLGMRRIALTLSGVTTSDRLAFATITACSAGCEAINVYPTNTNEVTLAYYTPALIIGAQINIPIAVYRVI